MLKHLKQPGISNYLDFAVTETTTPMTSPKISSKSIIKKTTLSEPDLELPDTDDLHTYETNTHDMKLSNDGLNKESSRYQMHWLKAPNNFLPFIYKTELWLYYSFTHDLYIESRRSIQMWTNCRFHSKQYLLVI